MLSTTRAQFADVKSTVAWYRKHSPKAAADFIGRDQVSRLEQRSDLLLSTLRGYVEAMGGRLKIVAEFSCRNSVLLSDFASPEN